MDLSALFREENAVSSVIGVILMVAITVILAAVIATFVLDLGQKTSNVSPEASFEFDYTDNPESGNCPCHDALNVTHDGGDSIAVDQLKLTSDIAFRGTGATPSVSGSTSAFFSDFDQYPTDSELTAGDTLDVESDGTSDANDFDSATIRIIWESTEGDSTATLARFTGPNA